MALTAEQHQKARADLLVGWTKVAGAPEPTIRRLQVVQAVGQLETSYGLGWKPPMTGSNNIGAVQCGSAECRAASLEGDIALLSGLAAMLNPCPPGTARYGDTHADGSKYSTCFATYPTFADGWAGLLRVLLKMRPAREQLDSGDAWAVARGMKEAGYYEGKGSPESAIAVYGARLSECAREASNALSEPYALGAPPSVFGGSPAPLLVGAAVGGLGYLAWRHLRG